MSVEQSVRATIPPRASTVVLTGAGFSVPAGLPVTSQLVSRGRERLKGEFLEALDALVCAVLEEPVGEDIEASLTRLRVLELYSKKYDYLREIFPLEMGIYFLIWVALLPSSNSPPLDLYDTFLERFGSDVAFASLNYDLVLENAFRRQQRAWHYALQGEANFHNDLSYREHFYAPLDEEPRSIAYLKLHGSFNWHYCWRCNYFRIVRDEWCGVSGFHLPRRDRDPLWVTSRGTLVCGEDECVISSGPGVGQAALKPLIIPPARVKEYSRAPVYRQWAFFDLLLAQAQELIVVGTSIRDEDVLLFNSLSLLRYKNPKLKTVVVINPSEEIAQKVEGLTAVETIAYGNLEEYLAKG
jgi:NAD-dependent SIR2 family protein deacetylase